MSDERKIELFYELLNYLCDCDTEKCVEVLQSTTMTKQEAIELEFFDSVTDQLSDEE